MIKVVKLYKHSLHFIDCTTIKKQVIQLILMMLVGIDVYVGPSSYERKPEYPEETLLYDLVTTWRFHMPTPGIEPGSQRWEASALPLRQSDSQNYKRVWIQNKYIFIDTGWTCCWERNKYIGRWNNLQFLLTKPSFQQRPYVDVSSCVVFVVSGDHTFHARVQLTY